MKNLPSICIALFMTTTAWASVTYTFTGANYTSTTNFTACTTGPCANYTTSMMVTGSFTLASALGANVSNQNIASLITAYSFSDGINTYTNTDPNSRIYEALVSTNASGNITSSDLLLEEWQSGTSPHSVGNRFAYIFIIGTTNALGNNNEGCASVGTTSPSSGVADVCNAVNPDTASSSASGPSGTWGGGSTAVPTLGEWGTICLVGLLVGFAVLRLRRQERQVQAA